MTRHRARASRIVRYRTGVATFVVAVIGAGLLVAYAALADGNPPHHAALNDDGVWVSTDRSDFGSAFGEISVQAKKYAHALFPPGASARIDVLQTGSAVLGWDQDGGTVTPIDPSSGVLLTDDALKIGSDRPALGGDNQSGSFALLDREHGKLYATHLSDTTVAPSFRGADPTGPGGIAVGSNADVAVGVDGTVHVASLDGGITTLTPAGSSFSKSQSKMPSGISGTVAITAVGSSLVALVGADASANPALVLPGHAAAIPLSDAQGAVLQKPGPANNVVYLETPSRLIAVDLKTGDPHTVGGSGHPEVPAAGAIAGQPVYLRGCVFAAWADGTSAYNNRLCGSSWASKTIAPANPPEPVNAVEYRVNHDEILLNDPLTGAVFVADGVPEQIDSWDRVHQPQMSIKPSNPDPSTGDSRKPPTAVDDPLGARAGTPDGARTTVLHVLDNDGVGGGSVLTVDSVTQPSTSSAQVAISPDKLSVLLTVDQGAPGSFSFTYFNNNGVAKSPKPATVDITIAPDGTFAAPNLRPAPKAAPLPITEPWSVPINGTISIPVLNDWRNKVTGDPVALAPLGVQPDLKGRAVTTTDGTIQYKAPSDPGPDVINYQTADGPVLSAPQQIKITIIAGGQHGVPPVANSDYAHGTVGSTFTINPLLNDIPGADPSAAEHAQLAIQGTVASKKNLDVVSQAADGTITLRGRASGAYTLSYADTYGTLVSRPASIRVDVLDPNGAAPIETGADSATVHGSVPALVDVLGNDFDPNGQLLTVVGWSAPAKSNLTAAVVGGRWVRVNENQAVSTSTIETLTYRVTDGLGNRMATGEITVTELPQLTAPAPLPSDDYAVVRQGDSVTVPVLDNDVIEDGSVLALQQDFVQAAGVTGLAHGQLPVSFVGNVSGNPGQAFVSGNVVRYVAPPRTTAMTSSQQVKATYRIVTAAGVTADATVYITVTPTGTKITDGAPIPQDLQARVVSGGETVIHVPTSGVDPDGDTVQVVGLARGIDDTSGPKLGSITAMSANSFTYKAFPAADNGGTDTFKYTVADTYGVQATATISVSVVSPTALPAPVPRPITVTAAPGTTVRIKVVSPAHVDYPEGDAPTLLDPKSTETGAGASLMPKDPTSLLLPVPKDSPKSFNVPYAVRGESGAVYPSGITVSVVDGYVAPPIAVDQFAHISGTKPEVVVGLDTNDFSQVAGATLSVVAPAVGQLVGTQLHVTVTDVPQVIPYVVKDSAGGEATGVVFIPAGGAVGLPYWNGKTIKLDKLDQAVPVDVNQFVKDPAGTPVRLLTEHDVWAAPAQLLQASVAGGSSSSLTLKSGKDSSGNLYQGPAAVTFPVVTGKDINATTYITVPVIIGDPAPVLRCPTDAVPVTQDDSTTIDIATECHVWTQDNDSSKLTFDLSFTKTIADVSVTTNGAHRPVITAGPNAPKKAPGTLNVSVHGSKGPGSVLNVRVVPARPLTIASIPVQTVTANVGKVIDLLPYVSSPFEEKHTLHFVGAPSTHQSVTLKPTGELGIEVNAASKKDLAATITFTVGDNNDTSRNRSATLLLQVLDVPSPPVNVIPRPEFLDKTIRLDWVASQPRGAQVTDYKIEYATASGSWSHDVDAGPATSFPVTVPENGVPYRFRVKACNGVKVGSGSDGCGDWSVVSPTKRAGRPPGPVTNLTASLPSGPGSLDTQGSVILSWKPPADDSEDVQFVYTITWQGGGPITKEHKYTDNVTLTGLPNDTPLLFTVKTQNEASLGVAGAPNSVPGESAGKPQTPTWPAATDTPPPYEVTSLADGTRDVTLHWNGVDPNGPSPTHYTVSRTDDQGGAPIDVCPDVSTATTCNDDNHIQDNGIVYTYSIVAWNDAGADGLRRADFSSGSASAPPMRASRQPTGISNLTAAPTGADGTALLTFDLGKSYGNVSTVTCIVNGHACDPSQPEWGFITDGQAGVQKTVTGLTNGQMSTFTLTACNDTTTQQHDPSSGNPCRTATPVSTVTYGQFGAPTVTASVSGNLITWTASGNADGRNVQVVVADQNGGKYYSKPWTSLGPTSWSIGGSSEAFTVPPSYTDSITVTVSDTGTTPTKRTTTQSTSNSVTSAALTITGNPSCSTGSTSVSCSWPAAVDKGTVTYHASWSGGSGPSAQASYTFSAPQDNQGHTFSVYATDDTGHTSNTVSTPYTDPAPPTAQLTVTTPTCPQDGFTRGRYTPGSPPTCSTPDGYTGGFIPRNTVLTVDCYQYENPAVWTYSSWYRITGGGTPQLNGMFVQIDTAGNYFNLPAC